ncbi:MAG TPA: hypothetical protein VNS46_16365 [Nocardioides sp.]|nr:hypothetical protein [Nocardioides sp.]
MSDPFSSYPPPPPPPYQQPSHQQHPVGGPANAPSNGPAIGSLVIGIVALTLALIPLLNLVGAVGTLVGIPLGIAGIRRGRRTGRGATLAAVGIVLSGVALVLSLLISFLFWRFLGDLLDFVEPPDPSAEVGEEFATDDGDLVITVTAVRCTRDDDYSGDCTFSFDVRNDSTRSISLGDVQVKSVVDGDWGSAYLDGETTTGPGERLTITGSVSVYGERLDGLVFDADDASSHSAVVVDTSAAWDRAATGK